MKKIIKFTIILAVIFFVGFACVSLVLYSGLFGILNSFNINSVTEGLDNEFTISFGKVKAANYYIVDIYDPSELLVYENKVTTNKIKVNFGDALENTAYTLKVTAYNKKGKSKEANNTYDFKYTATPSFSDSNTYVLNDDDALIYIDGDLSNKKYSLKIEEFIYDDEENQTDDKVLYNKIYSEDTYELSSESYKDKIVKITATLTYDDKEIDSINLYNNMNPLEELVISSPENDSIIDYSDVLLKFNEEEAAESYKITLYDSKGKAYKSTTIFENEVVLDKNLFYAGSTYSIGVVAINGDYSVESKKTFTTDTYSLNPVYMNKDASTIKSGEEIELLSSSEGTIIYTVDGTNPIEGGLQYNGPITISEDTELQAYIKNDRNISKVSSFDIKVDDTNKIKVYLSSSNQSRNIGVDPFTNERYELSLIRDEIKNILEKNNVEVITNDFLVDANHQNEEATNSNVNLKVALETESSSEHEKTGMTTWVSKITSPSYGIASLLNKNLSTIYTGTNNGIRCAGDLSNFEGKDLGENGTISNVVLSIGYHDNETDAKWIVENRKTIAENIANTILEYYGLA